MVVCVCVCVIVRVLVWVVGCRCFLLQLLASFFLSCLNLSLLLEFPLLTCDGALSHKVNLASCCHPLWLPLPCPVLLVLLFVGPGVKDPPGDLHLRLCAHLDAITRNAFPRL